MFQSTLRMRYASRRAPPPGPPAAPAREASRPRVPPKLLPATLLGLLVVIAAAALGARWGGGHAAAGARLEPRPDALEYAASAQDIAQSFRFTLAIGPHRVRPRYPPGWPLLLALAIRLGVPGEELWRVAGLCGAGLACLIGLGAAVSVWRLALAGGTSPPRALLAAAGAGLLGGMAWALAPLAVAAGSAVLSDEPAALCGALALTLGGCAGMAAPRTAARHRDLAALGSGFATGVAATLRPAGALLLLPALALLACGRPAPGGVRRGLRLLLLWAAGGAAAPLLTIALLLHSGLSPWRWSGYLLWAPRWFADLGATFNLRYALAGNTDFERGPHGTPLPNVLYYGKILLGLPGLEPSSYLGILWPAFAWACGLALAWHLARLLPGEPDLSRRPLRALPALVVAYFGLHALYFYPSARFLLLPLAAAPYLLAVAIGLGLAAPSGPWLRRAALAAALLWAASLVQGLGAIQPMAPTAAAPQDVRRQVREWLRLPDAERARTTLPFDPVEAQALGLLPPEVVQGIGSWGALPNTVHVRRLRALGLLR
jgi:hypothetical protein